jgi:hypothetical protein
VSVDCISVEILEDDNNSVKLTQIAKNIFFNTKRYVDVTKVKLGSRTLEDVEAESYENCVFKYRNLEYELKCKILTTEVIRTVPGIIPVSNKLKRAEHSEYSLSNYKEINLKN